MKKCIHLPNLLSSLLGDLIFYKRFDHWFGKKWNHRIILRWEGWKREQKNLKDQSIDILLKIQMCVTDILYEEHLYIDKTRQSYTDKKCTWLFCRSLKEKDFWKLFRAKVKVYFALGIFGNILRSTRVFNNNLRSMQIIKVITLCDEELLARIKLFGVYISCQTLTLYVSQRTIKYNSRYS